MNKKPSWGRSLSALEKKWFPWRKSNLVQGRPAFFPGCNLVNFLPETTLETIRIFSGLNCGWLYDCCGKPLQQVGDKAAVSKVIGRINGQLKAAAVTELIVACPNCHGFLQNQLSVPVKDIYTFLKESNIPSTLGDTLIHAFPPCPDRGSGKIRQAVAEWTGGIVQEAVGLPCCGLGIADPEKSRNAVHKIGAAGLKLSPYCASCYGHLTSRGVDMEQHILTEGLGLKEPVSQGFRKAVNRLKPWFWK